MLRIAYTVIISLPFVLFYLWKLSYIEKHDEQYTETQRYETARHAISIMIRNGRIHTDVYGTENLPKDGGYVMYANHQGKYDALGIISAHSNPCTIMIDEKRSHLFLTDQFITLLKGSRLDRTNMKNQVKTILDVTAQVKSGRRYIIFPEGGYSHNKNDVHEFLPGAFKCAMKSQSPIIPVALIDSYKPFGVNSIKPVKTQVHFLSPIYYEDYKEMTSREISELTRSRIIHTIQEACS